MISQASDNSVNVKNRWWFLSSGYPNRDSQADSMDRKYLGFMKITGGKIGKS
jgi:hypothetical protein